MISRWIRRASFPLSLGCYIIAEQNERWYREMHRLHRKWHEARTNNLRLRTPYSYSEEVDARNAWFNYRCNKPFTLIVDMEEDEEYLTYVKYLRWMSFVTGLLGGSAWVLYALK